MHTLVRALGFAAPKQRGLLGVRTLRRVHEPHHSGLLSGVLRLRRGVVEYRIRRGAHDLRREVRRLPQPLPERTHLVLPKVAVAKDLVEDDEAARTQPIARRQQLQHGEGARVQVAVNVKKGDRLALPVQKRRQALVEPAGHELNELLVPRAEGRRRATHTERAARGVRVVVAPLFGQTAEGVKAKDRRRRLISMMGAVVGNMANRAAAPHAKLEPQATVLGHARERPHVQRIVADDWRLAELAQQIVREARVVGHRVHARRVRQHAWRRAEASWRHRHRLVGLDLEVLSRVRVVVVAQEGEIS